MLTRSEMKEAINQPQPLNETEKENVKHQEEFIRNAIYYSKCSPPETQGIVGDYKREIQFLKSLKEMNPESFNINQQEALSRGENVLKTPTKDARKAREQEQSLRLVRKQERRAGYMNATIIIFVVANFGLLIAALLLISS